MGRRDAGGAAEGRIFPSSRLGGGRDHMDGARRGKPGCRKVSGPLGVLGIVQKARVLSSVANGHRKQDPKFLA